MEDLKKSFLVRGDNIIGALGDKYFSTAPLGTVLSFAGQTAPHGYLLCDGASYKVADYPHLYAVIGNTYGGDTENFNVPNLVDKFIQGSNTSGTEKEAGLPNITGNISKTSSSDGDNFLSDTTTTSTSTSGALYVGSYKNVKSMSNGESAYNSPASIDFDASFSNSIYGNSDTVQPPALTMVYIIKAFHTNEGTDSGLDDETIELINREIDNKTPSIDVQEVEGGHSVTITDKNGEETFNVPDGKDGAQIDDSATNTTSVWSSSKTKSYVDTLHPSYTSVAKGASYDTGWKIKSVTNGDMCRIAVVNIYDYSQSSGGNKMATYLYLITANYTNTTTLNMAKITSNGNTTTDGLFEFSVSSNGTIVFTNKSDAATDKMWVKLIKP